LLFTFKNRFPTLNPYWEKYTALQQRAEYPARTTLLQEAKTAQNYYFVEQGCLRLCFDNKGKDTTVQFFFENEGVASLESFQKNIPSVFTIETIEPGVILVLPKAVFNGMVKELERYTVATLPKSCKRKTAYREAGTTTLYRLLPGHYPGTPQPDQKQAGREKTGREKIAGEKIAEEKTHLITNVIA
jgi:hypothetical protein